MGAVVVKCPACKKEFPSMIQFDKASFENPTNRVENNGTACPHCRKGITFSKADMRFKD